MEVLVFLLPLVGLFLAWGLIYLAVKYGVLNAMRQLDRERGDAGTRG